MQLNVVKGRRFIIRVTRHPKICSAGWKTVLRKPTYSRFCALLDNYSPHQGYEESVIQQDKHEEAAFIEEISRSAPIKYLHRYLVLKEATCQDYEDFKKMLASLWFDLCGRGGCSSSSSAFEHVFVGEIKGRGKVRMKCQALTTGFSFTLKNSTVTLITKGTYSQGGVGSCLTLKHSCSQFEWHGVLKYVSSTLVGVSPEFELHSTHYASLLEGKITM